MTNKKLEIFEDLQQWTDEWLKVRAWSITWTWLKNIILKELKKWGYTQDSINKQKKYIYELLGGEFSYDDNAPIIKTYLLNAWNEFEELAKMKYEWLTWNKVIEVWFIKKESWLWISPDWIIYNDKKVITKAIEIKSPLWNNSANFYKYMFEDKIPDEYLWQVVHYFIVIDTLEELDFIVFNPNYVKSEKQLWIKNIKRSDLKEEIAIAEKDLKNFRKKWVKHIKILLK